MDRRKFVGGSLGGLAGLSGLAAGVRTGIAAMLEKVPAPAASSAQSLPRGTGRRLFPTNVHSDEWIQFPARGFSKPVCGVILRTDKPASDGVPLGGISTGFLQLESWGVYGFSTAFCVLPRLSLGDTPPGAIDPWYASPVQPYPTSPRSYQPLLGLATGGKTWVLVSKQVRAGGYFPDESDDIIQRIAPAAVPELKDVKCAREIHYWGHYPVVDIEYDTDAPISVGLRAWSPFIPGDAVSSNTPGAVFEIHLRNVSGEHQKGTLAFSFPGPSQVEAQFSPASPRKGSRSFETWIETSIGYVPEASSPVPALRQAVREQSLNGVAVASEMGVGYFLGIVGSDEIRSGGGLKVKEISPPEGSAPSKREFGGTDWATIASELPAPQPTDFSGSVAVDFELPPGQEKIVRIVLAWYQPIWYFGKEELYTQMYASRFSNATEVARLLAREHGSLLRRILGWQEVIYSDAKLPPWLGDVLINSLATIGETSFWSMGKGVLEKFGADGYFGLIESPRFVIEMAGLACHWYGNLPIVYLFPDLMRSTLRAMTHEVREDGAAPLYVANDGSGRGYNVQASTNAACFVDHVDRVWQSTGDDTVLRECYPAVKRTTIWSMTQKPVPEGIISVAGVGKGGMAEDWWEVYRFFGMSPHVGGMRLAALRMAERMAEKMGDDDFTRQCRSWFEQGSKAMEEHLWAGRYYLLYSEPASGRRSDVIMACQLDGEWAGRFHGLPGVFPVERVRQTLQTVRQLCLDEIVGALPFVTPDGNLTLYMEHRDHFVVPYAIFPPETTVLGMTYLYAGDASTGLEIIRRNWYNMVCRQRHAWNLPNLVRPYSGRTARGTEYFQNTIVWAVPVSIEGKTLREACTSGSLVDRVIQAGKKT